MRESESCRCSHAPGLGVGMWPLNQGESHSKCRTDHETRRALPAQRARRKIATRPRCLLVGL